MKLINEAVQDEKFNMQIGKIQDAIIKLEKIAQEFGKDVPPVRSQRFALDTAIADLEKICKTMFK